MTSSSNHPVSAVLADAGIGLTNAFAFATAKRGIGVSNAFESAAAVTAMATAPQNVTRTAPVLASAPPASAASPEPITNVITIMVSVEMPINGTARRS